MGGYLYSTKSSNSYDVTKCILFYNLKFAFLRKQEHYLNLKRIKMI